MFNYCTVTPLSIKWWKRNIFYITWNIIPCAWFIKSKCKFIGVAVTGHKTEKIAKFDQGFVACISGIITVMNEGPDTLHPGALLTWEVCDKYPIQHGIHARKVRFRFAKAKEGDEIVGKVLSYSKKGSTVDILLHPVKSR